MNFCEEPKRFRRSKNGAPSWDRTNNLHIRSVALYPVELWVRFETLVFLARIDAGNQPFLLV